jgi:ribosome-associated protein
MAPIPILLRDEYITLAQAVKVAGLVDSGGQAKRFVRENNMMVNGALEQRPGRKLVAGDHIVLADQEWIIQP